ncbi:MAG: DUF445 family protein [Planctomycetota bacterium]
MSPPWSWIVLPAVGALIGLATNWIAIRMLFRPRRPIRFLGLSIQGVLPKRREELAARAARVVEERLLGPEGIEKALAREEVRSALRSSIEEHLRKAALERIARIPFVGGLVPDAIPSMFAEALAKEAANALPAWAASARGSLGLKAIITENIAGMDLDRLESLAMETAGRELSVVIWLGAILGAIVGLAEAAAAALLR